MHCMASKNLCGRNASLCACSSAAFQIYIWFTIAIARGGSGARARSCSNSTQSACPVCAEWVSWLSLSLSVQGYQVTTGPFSAHRERERASPIPIHPSVRPSAGSYTNRASMANGTHHPFCTCRVFLLDAVRVERVHTRTQKKRERTHSLTLALPVCFFASRKGARIYIVFAAMS